MEVLKIKENKDGSATMDYTLDEEELTWIKRILKVKRLTRNRINKFILNTLHKIVQKEIENINEIERRKNNG